MFSKKKMKLSQENMDTLMIKLNRIIENTADNTAKNINDSKIGLAYPPNNGLTDDEKNAISKLQGNPVLKSALRNRTGQEWQKELSYCTELVKEYLSTGKYSEKLKDKKAVGIGFVDGDIEILY